MGELTLITNMESDASVNTDSRTQATAFEPVSHWRDSEQTCEPVDLCVDVWLSWSELAMTLDLSAFVSSNRCCRTTDVFCWRGRSGFCRRSEPDDDMWEFTSLVEHRLWNTGCGSAAGEPRCSSRESRSRPLFPTFCVHSRINWEDYLPAQFYMLHMLICPEHKHIHFL